jgi:hypothetical protein
MSIIFIYGAPRSGKTYYAVNEIVSEYFEFNKDIGRYHLKKKYANLKIVTNIDGLSLPHESLYQVLDKAGGRDAFFTKENQEHVSKKYPQVIYLIDEAHEFFPSNYRNNSVFDWFSYHAHYGQQVYVISQSYSRIARQIVDMAEICLYALPKSLSFTGGRELRYNVVSGREIVSTKTLLKKQKIFDLYKSQNSHAVEKKITPMLKYTFGFLLLVSFMVYRAYVWIWGAEDQETITQVYQSPPTIEKNLGALDPIKNLPDGVRQVEKKPEIQVVRVRVDYIGGGKIFRIIDQDRMWTVRQYPYDLEYDGATLYALIPEKEHKLREPETQPRSQISPDRPSAGKRYHSPETPTNYEKPQSPLLVRM